MLDVLRDQLNRRQPMDNVSRNLLRLLTATCGFKEARLMAVQRLEMWLQNPKVLNCSSLALILLLISLGCSMSLFCPPFVAFAVDSSSSGPPHVAVHELQHPWDRRHGGDFQPDQDPTQTQSPAQPLHAVCQVRELPVSFSTQSKLLMRHSSITHG